MERIQIDFTQSFQKAKQFLDAFNQSCKKEEKIHASVRSTAELILRVYIKQVHHSQLPITDTLPPFDTYNTSLAEFRDCSPRTIIHHRKRLLKAEFLLSETRTGNQGLSLFINPNLIKKVLTVHVENSKASRPKNGKPRPNVKNFHSLDIEHIYTKDNINSTVDKWTSPQMTAASFCKNTREDVIPEKKEQASSSPGRIFQQRLIEDFWQTAQKTIYKKWDLHSFDHRMIKTIIYHHLYGKFNEPATEAEWMDYHRSLIDRLRMVNNWLKKDPANWIAAPIQYFDKRNKTHGFGNTWKWLLKRKIIKLETENQTLLQKLRPQRPPIHRLTVFKQQRKRLDKTPDLEIAYFQSKKRNAYLKKKVWNLGHPIRH